MKRQLFFSGLFVLAGLIVSCNHTGDNPQDMRTGEHIEKLEPLFSKNAHTITVNYIEETLVEIDPDIESTLLLDSTLIADLSDVAFDEKYIYLADKKLHQVFRYDRENQQTEIFGREGRGPGEFNEPREMGINSGYLFVNDNGNGRIQVFNKNFELAEQNSGVGITSSRFGSMAVNDEYMLLSDPLSLEQEHVIGVISLDTNFNKTGEILPRLLQPGDPKFSVNVTQIRPYLDEGFAVSYSGLPYLFFLDRSLDSVFSYTFSGDYVDDFYETIPDRMRNAPRNYLRIFIHSFDFYKDRLFLLVGGDLFLVDMVNHTVLKRYRFSLNDEYVFGTMIRVYDSSLYLIDRTFSNRIIEIPMDSEGALFSNGKYIL